MSKKIIKDAAFKTRLGQDGYPGQRRTAVSDVATDPSAREPFLYTLREWLSGCAKHDGERYDEKARKAEHSESVRLACGRSVDAQETHEGTLLRRVVEIDYAGKVPVAARTKTARTGKPAAPAAPRRAIDPERLAKIGPSRNVPVTKAQVMAAAKTVEPAEYGTLMRIGKRRYPVTKVIVGATGNKRDNTWRCIGIAKALGFDVEAVDPPQALAA